MNERFLPVRASLLLARRALERQLALTQAGIPPSVDGLAEVLAEVDAALKALDALEKIPCGWVAARLGRSRPPQASMEATDADRSPRDRAAGRRPSERHHPLRVTRAQQGALARDGERAGRREALEVHRGGRCRRRAARPSRPAEDGGGATGRPAGPGGRHPGGGPRRLLGAPPARGRRDREPRRRSGLDRGRPAAPPGRDRRDRRREARRRIGCLLVHHLGHDKTKSYGDSTKEWQLDYVMLGEGV